MSKKNRLLKTMEFSCPETQKKIVGFVDNNIESKKGVNKAIIYENLFLYAIAKLENDQDAKEDALYILGKEYYDKKEVL